MVVDCVVMVRMVMCCCVFFFFQAEDGIRDLVRSRGLGDVYKRQYQACAKPKGRICKDRRSGCRTTGSHPGPRSLIGCCLLYTSDAADERSSVDLGGRRIIKKKKIRKCGDGEICSNNTSKTRYVTRHKVESS